MIDILSKLKMKILIPAIAIYWIIALRGTDSYYSNYLCIGWLCILCGFLYDEIEVKNKRDFFITAVFSFIFSAFVTAANYSIINNDNHIYRNVVMLSILISGMIVFFVLLSCSRSLIGKLYRRAYYSEIRGGSHHDSRVFLITFFVIVTVDLLILFLSQYPGEVTTDSIIQMQQIASGIYSNHHPYWHTMIIKACTDLGYALFKNINAAVATYMVFQVVVMALIEAFANMTLKQLGTRPLTNILFCLFFAALPYNVLYSITMWKDILFGGMILLFITCLVRIIRNLGSKVVNYIVFFVSCIGFGLLRSNGWYAFAATTIVFAFVLCKNKRVILIIMALGLACTFILKYPVLKRLGVTQPDLIESLSIPSQQIARVIADDNDLSAEDKQLLDEIIEVDRISETYICYISDPIKDLVRQKNNQQYLSDHMGEYLDLYIKLGITYPESYIHAFIDQTRGYYNSGYDYWKWTSEVRKNDLGVVRTDRLPALTQQIVSYANAYPDIPILNPFISIGLHVWMIIGCLYIGIINRDKDILMLTIPLLTIVATLLIAAPVYSEFRYVYSIFTCAYFVILVTMKFSNESVSSVDVLSK